MSIVRSLKLLFDPIEYRAEMREQKRKQQARPSDVEGDDEPPAGDARCRTCGFTGRSPICLCCLTATMEPRW